MSNFFTILPLCADGRFIAPPGRFDTIEEARAAAEALAITQPVVDGHALMQCVEIVSGAVADPAPAEDPPPDQDQDAILAERIAAFSAALAARLAAP